MGTRRCSEVICVYGEVVDGVIVILVCQVPETAKIKAKEQSICFFIFLTASFNYQGFLKLFAIRFRMYCV